MTKASKLVVPLRLPMASTFHDRHYVDVTDTVGQTAWLTDTSVIDEKPYALAAR